MVVEVMLVVGLVGTYPLENPGVLKLHVTNAYARLLFARNAINNNLKTVMKWFDFKV